MISPITSLVETSTVVFALMSRSSRFSQRHSACAAARTWPIPKYETLRDSKVFGYSAPGNVVAGNGLRAKLPQLSLALSKWKVEPSNNEGSKGGWMSSSGSWGWSSSVNAPMSLPRNAKIGTLVSAPTSDSPTSGVVSSAVSNPCFESSLETVSIQTLA